MLMLSVALALLLSTNACPFCSAQGTTLSGEVAQADLIVLGSLKNAKKDPNDISRGTTELHIEKIVKPHDYLNGKKFIVLPRYVPADPAAGTDKYIVFCNVYSGPAENHAAVVASTLVLGNTASYQLDSYRGEPAKAESNLADYLAGAIKVRTQPIKDRLKYFFNYLDNPELIISSDAYLEFGNAEYADVRELAKTLDSQKLVAWLNDPNTPASRYGLYGLLLGHCGKKSDAEVLRRMLDDPAKSYSSGLDGVAAAYVLLEPETGWKFVSDTIADSKREFPVRYAGLKVLRFFWEYRPDVVSKDKILGAMKVLVRQSDLADLPIEDLRKWEQWQLAGDIIEIGQLESHKSIPIVRRSVLRFALSAPEKELTAAAYVKQMREADPDRVKMIEEMLKDEKPKMPGKK
jgi:hypothetical protein